MNDHLAPCARLSAGGNGYFSDINMTYHFHPTTMQGYLLFPGSTANSKCFPFSYFQTSYLLAIFCGMEHKGVIFFLVPEIALIGDFTDPFIAIRTFFYQRWRRDQQSCNLYFGCWHVQPFKAQLVIFSTISRRGTS